MLIHVDGDTLVVQLTGHLTGPSCVELRDTVLARRPGVTNVHLDAADVTAISDSVFSVLLAGAAWLRLGGGDLAFKAASATVRRSLSALGLLERLPVLPVIPQQATHRISVAAGSVAA